jgi:hypothetical protein
VPAVPVGDSTFPKSIIVLSVLPDIARIVYRHRETGFLIDPGTAILRRVSEALTDLSFAKWFRANFESLGRITVDEFAENLKKLVPLIERETGARVAVFNALEIEPGDTTYDYSTRNIESATRRRRFNLALYEVADATGMAIVDVDNALKREGVHDQVDFSHFPVAKMRAVAAAALDVFTSLGAFSEVLSVANRRSVTASMSRSDERTDP